jgi:hypothetical protein
LRECDQNRGPPHARQFRGCLGRQLAHSQNGHRPHRQNRAPPFAVRTTSFARHAGHSFRHLTGGRSNNQPISYCSSAARSAALSNFSEKSGSSFCHRHAVATCTPALAHASRNVHPARREATIARFAVA